MEKQMLYIRTDANDVIATGHIMRCLSIADALKKLGVDTTFIFADEQALSFIKERGYQAIVLYSNWREMDSELKALQNVIKKYEIKSLLIDSYMITQHYLQSLSEQVKTIYIDDINAFVYPVNAIICYAVYWRKFCYQKKYPKAKLLLGLRFVPLRQVFCGCKEKIIKPTIENLLILSGGTDNYQILEQLLQSLEIARYKRIDVVCGIYYRDYDALCGRYSRFSQIHFFKAVNNVEEHMIKADMAISAGGTTLYELCAVGTPTISYSFADNQLDNVLQFQEEGMIDYAGDIRYTNVFKNINRILDSYFSDFLLRREKSRHMQALVDGKGSERIAKILIKMNEKAGT